MQHFEFVLAQETQEGNSLHNINIEYQFYKNDTIAKKLYLFQVKW